MKNNIFDIEFDKNDGTIMSLMLLNDKDKMNWCADLFPIIGYFAPAIGL